MRWVAGGRTIDGGMDCWGCCLWYLRQLGARVPPDAAPWDVGSESHVAAYLRVRDAQSGWWEEVPAPSRLGDVVLCESLDGPHAAPVVELNPCRVASLEARTRVRLIDPQRLRVLGCYRLRVRRAPSCSSSPATTDSPSSRSAPSVST